MVGNASVQLPSGCTRPLAAFKSSAPSCTAKRKSDPLSASHEFPPASRYPVASALSLMLTSPVNTEAIITRLAFCSRLVSPAPSSAALLTANRTIVLPASVTCPTALSVTTALDPGAACSHSPSHKTSLPCRLRPLIETAPATSTAPIGVAVFPAGANAAASIETGRASLASAPPKAPTPLVSVSTTLRLVARYFLFMVVNLL